MKYFSVVILVVLLNACATGRKSSCSVFMDNSGRQHHSVNAIQFVNLQKDRTRRTFLYDVQGTFTGNLNRLTQQLIEKLTVGSEPNVTVSDLHKSIEIKIDDFYMRATKDGYIGYVSMLYSADGVKQQKLTVLKEYMGDPVQIQENVILDLKEEFIKSASLCSIH